MAMDTKWLLAERKFRHGSLSGSYRGVLVGNQMRTRGLGSRGCVQRPEPPVTPVHPCWRRHVNLAWVDVVELNLTAKEEPIAARAGLCVLRCQTPRPPAPGPSLRPTQAPLSFETED